MNDTPICASVERDLGVDVDVLTAPAPVPASDEQDERPEGEKP